MASPPTEVPVTRSAVTSPSQLLYPPYREPCFELAAIQGAALIAAVWRKSPRNPPKRCFRKLNGWQISRSHEKETLVS
ncbi:uncharacterized protein Z519_04574 [Cladophialophora bantiana CBS 173.52]|uniref:Uncharacterized protein n=1 Tax=Cladophialophora bantiana (strain ATCC 10958 / CBS 173.52 / CDC B-1940 / NIH 8579) TaxID=1442370 RepID=A0A0D2HML8_CLAB1|nr:uncharacterized protein Z519_04574 [Cladophialophora bantiana CBS 173.52]KIW94598.1 hypothetical protein Z519_04574 [Cladophialophora bantiana CBS 173.52]